MKIDETRDAAIELAKDLLIHDFGPLLLDLESRIDEGNPILPFYRFVISLHAARGAAEEFRLAHIEQQRISLRSKMEKDLAEELARIDSLTPEEIAARRAS